MRFEDYLPLAKRTEKMYPTRVERLVHASLGIASEIGELFEDEVDVSEEVGDLLWYLAIFYNACPELFVLSFHDSQEGHLGFTLSRERMVANLGELVGLVKKMHIYSRPFEDVSSELQDQIDRSMEWLQELVWSKGLRVPEILEANIDKLRKRYPERYTDEAAAARADKA